MTVFLRRFIGALVLDASVYEDIEADRAAALQSWLVVALAAAGGGVAAAGLGLIGVAGFIVGAVALVGAWLVWITAISMIGTVWLPEPQTQSSTPELTRTLGFAMAPGVFLAFAAMQAVAPLVILVVSVWMIAAAVLAMRQALDYRSTSRAVIVCITGWVMAFGIIAAIAAMLTAVIS